MKLRSSSLGDSAQELILFTRFAVDDTKIYFKLPRKLESNQFNVDRHGRF